MTVSTAELMAKLFQWKTTVQIAGVDFYMRVVSDHVIDDARREALLQSRKLRKELRNVDSDDFLIYLDPLADLTAQDLKNLIISVGMRDVMREYMNTNPRPIILPLGDNPSQEEQEEHEAAKQAREGAYISEMEVYVNNWRTDFEQMLDKRTEEDLLLIARGNRVDQVCEEKFTEVFETHVVAASIYTDKTYKSRLFTIEQFTELPPEVRRQMRDAYNEMSISPDQIKN